MKRTKLHMQSTAPLSNIILFSQRVSSWLASPNHKNHHPFSLHKLQAIFSHTNSTALQLRVLAQCAGQNRGWEKDARHCWSSTTACTGKPSSTSPLPAVHDGWMVLPILLLAQDDERLLLPDPHSLCTADRHFGWSLCLLSMQLWAQLCLSCANICFLLSTLALKEEILCEIQGSTSSRSSSSATPAGWEKKNPRSCTEKSIVSSTPLLPETFLRTRIVCCTIAPFNIASFVVESLISPFHVPSHTLSCIKGTTTSVWRTPANIRGPFWCH